MVYEDEREQSGRHDEVDSYHRRKTRFIACSG
jgi:hypothetical protein